MTTTSSPILDALRSTRATVIGPDDPGYDEARTVLYDDAARPLAIARPADATEVARVVDVARETGVELAIRGGGHSGAGHGTSDGGIVLDLERLDGIDLDVAGRAVWAGTGLTAGEVGAAVTEHGLVIGFGDTASVGIGGLTSGGGIGYLVRKFGMTIDNVLAAEVVTADGRVRIVDAEHEPDLFWAVRGGAGNVAVATRFQYRLHELPELVGGMLILPATAETIAGFLAAAERAPDELSTIANVMPLPPMPFVPAEHHGELVILATLAYAGGPDAAGPILAPFRALATPLADMVRPIEYKDLFPPEDPDYHPIAAARTMFLDHVDRNVAARIVDTLMEHNRTSNAQMVVTQLRALGGAMARVPVDATAFAHRHSRIMVSLAALVPSKDDLPAHTAWVEAYADALRQGDHGRYVNFLMDEGPEAVAAAFPAETGRRLAEIKGRYDPTNVFRRNQNVAPA
ncbi:MAG TPA: FAD-binding oxidoreductase [Candidatus Limnocylindrales bacterium]|nr:FAD-binding oxidoreductase [Candidatus Limnocylindrales bacterium]